MRLINDCKAPTHNADDTMADKYDDYDWKELPEDVKEAAKKLGYTKKLWDGDKGKVRYRLDGAGRAVGACELGGCADVCVTDPSGSKLYDAELDVLNVLQLRDAHIMCVFSSAIHPDNLASEPDACDE